MSNQFHAVAWPEIDRRAAQSTATLHAHGELLDGHVGFDAQGTFDTHGYAPAAHRTQGDDHGALRVTKCGRARFWAQKQRRLIRVRIQERTRDREALILCSAAPGQKNQG
jgi:hypothetical protein